MTEPVFIGHRGYHDKIYGYFPMSQKTNFVNIARHLGFKVCYSGVRNEYDGHCTIIAPTDIYLNEIPVVLGNLVGGIAFTGLTLYATHIKTGAKRKLV